MQENIYVWKDINGNKYKLNDIDNRYLLNILNFISRGGGNIGFLNKQKIKLLFTEANNRNLKHNLTIEMLLNSFEEKLNCWANEPDFWS